MRAHISWWSALAIGLLVQTTVLTHLMPDAWRPDFTRALVLWLALTGIPASGGAWCALAAGAGLDALTGSPLGFGMLLRLSVYALARPARGILEHSPIIFALGPAAVFAEFLIVWMMKALLFASPPEFQVLAGLALRQAVVEAFAVPLVFLILEASTGYRTEMGTSA